jgi:glycosyltransferase involved in cell wall biosynthesis
MRARGAHLLIVGEGPEAATIRARVADLGVADLVTLDSRWQDPTGVMRAADVLVSAASSEGGPLTLYEAELAGARVVATPVGVAPDVVAADSASLLAAGSRPSDLAAALIAATERGATTDDERAARVAAAARWDVAETSPAFYDLVRSVLPPRSGAEIA